MSNPVSTRKSIRARLSRLVVVSVGLALGCSAVLNLWQEASQYLADKRAVLLATANVVAAAASNAVVAGESPLVLESLRSIARVPGLVYARVEDADGRSLAQIGGAVRLEDELNLDDAHQSSVWDLLWTRTIQVAVPVIDGGLPVGRLLLVSETQDLVARFLNVLAIGAVWSAMAMGVGLVIAHRLQKSIVGPLIALSEDMARIARTHDYGGSVTVAADDETGALAGSFNAMMEEIRNATVAIVDREAEVIFRLSRATEQRDNETGQHILRMSQLCRLVGEGLGLDHGTVDALHRAAPLHDVGKIAVPDAIMFKAGKLDAAERREMERHTSFGYAILCDSGSELIRLAAEMAWSHHERWDGTGYPRGLAGDGIPLAGRVAAVADVCDALASERPYKKAWRLEEVRAHLLQNCRTHFDPACVDALMTRWSEVERLYPQNAAGGRLQAA